MALTAVIAAAAVGSIGLGAASAAGAFSAGEAPGRDSKAVRLAADAERRRRVMATGRQQTILSSDATQSGGQLGTKTLLGQ